jgi:general secretion pathway protein C
MTTTKPTLWFQRLLTLLVWAGLGASLVFWVLRWSQSAPVALPVAAPVPVANAPDSAAVARVLGAAPAAAAAPASVTSRLSLTGVVARSESGTGAALIAIDGKPARAFAVGSKVEEGLYLITVAPRQANLAASPSGAVTVRLEMPAKTAGKPG